MTADTATVLIFDEYPLIRDGLAHTLNDESGLSVCAETGDVNEVLRLASIHEPDVAIISISTQETSGLGLVASLCRQHPKVKVLVLSKRDEAKVAYVALRAGAKGCANKSATSAEIVAAVKTMLEGQIAITDSTAAVLLDQLTTTSAGKKELGVSGLCLRELEVLELTGHGFTRREIARRLGLSTRTIDSYRHRIKGKLDIKSMPDLVRYAVNWLENGDGVVAVGA